MAIGDETLRLIADLRGRTDDVMATRTLDIVRSWVRMWDDVTGPMAAAVDDILEASVNGRWPARRTILRLERVTKALAVTTEALDELARKAGVSTSDGGAQIAGIVVAAQAAIIVSQLPRTGVPLGELAQVNRVDTETMTTLAEQTKKRTVTTLAPMAAAVTLLVKNRLIQGVAMDGRGSVVSRMLRTAETAFNRGMADALRVAKSELADAGRYAAFESHKRNAGLLSGWMWIASRDRRCCPACFAMHGTVHPIDEMGPSDHANGRCSRLAIVRPWSDLGLGDIPEPEPPMIDGRAAFNQLSDADQLAVMGPGRLAALRSGRIDWSDLATRRDVPGWRPAYFATPLRDL